MRVVGLSGGQEGITHYALWETGLELGKQKSGFDLIADRWPEDRMYIPCFSLLGLGSMNGPVGSFLAVCFLHCSAVPASPHLGTFQKMRKAASC